MKTFWNALRFDIGCAVILGLPLVMFLLMGAWVWYWLDALPVSSRALSQVVPGMAASDVEKLLGPPTDRELTCWRYRSSGLWTMVYVRLDEAQQVRAVEIDN